MHAHLEAQGIKVSKGTIVDATIIKPPSSTKNASDERDPDMHKTKKGNQWYFGMKALIAPVGEVERVRCCSRITAVCPL